MTSQFEKDNEEYHLGLQGTSTGSDYNMAGLNDRPAGNDYFPSAEPSQSASTHNKKARPVANDDFSYAFATIVFIAIAFYFYNPVAENGELVLVGAGIAGLVAGVYRKLIVRVGLVVGVVYYFAVVNSTFFN